MLIKEILLKGHTIEDREQRTGSRGHGAEDRAGTAEVEF